jgi:hypothetical protein
VFECATGPIEDNGGSGEGGSSLSASDHDESSLAESSRRAATPVAGSVAGILFAILFATSVLLIRISLAEAASDPGAWLQTGVSKLRFGLALVPFAGLFFLWFIAVARERLGRHEDQFFATVFLGSGLLFLAMMFAAAAAAGAIAATFVTASFGTSSTYAFARSVVAQIFNVYALRMAAVFLISSATLWLRTKVMPRWMAILTYVVALLLLVVVSQAAWVILVFPAWVFLVSAYILVTHLRRGPSAGGW